MDSLPGSNRSVVDFLTLPTEVRLAIYRYVFRDLTVPLLCDPESGASPGGGGSIESERGRLRYARPIRQGRGSRMRTASSSSSSSSSSSKEENAARLAQGVSILLVCRTAYDEAREVFFQTATFEVQAGSESEDDDQGTGVPNTSRTASMTSTATDILAETDASTSPNVTLPSEPSPSPLSPSTHFPASQIRNLSIPYSLLSHYAPSIFQKRFPSLTRVQIRQITMPLGHNKLSRLTPDLQTLQSSAGLTSGDSPKHDIEHAPGLRLFQTLLCAMEGERHVEEIMAHYAACHGRYELVLHFVLRCRHVGLLYVPGLFPFRRRPHRHTDEVVTYTFNAGARTGG